MIASDQELDALIALDKMDKAGAEGVARELASGESSLSRRSNSCDFFEGLARAEQCVWI